MKEKLELIDKAIDKVLSSLENGIDIVEWEIDGVRIKKKSPLELITELNKLKSTLKAQSRPSSVQYVFGSYGK